MNLYDTLGLNLTNEVITPLLENKNLRLERIVSHNHTTGWYDQEETEWLVLLTGEAEICFENKTIILTAGDTLQINPHERHRVSRTTDCIWLCLFYNQEE